MTRFQRLRRFVIPIALTVAGLVGTARLATANEFISEPGAGCSNNECEGVSSCRFMAGISCSFNADGSSCTNTRCAGNAM
jgi:hypothetical protein